jgi:gamma-glutamyl-gamma-aminobutyrate hydrolase PuuD
VKHIGITQRSDVLLDRQETRDALDRRWVVLLENCNFLPIIIPNYLPAARAMVSSMRLDGLILSGGNSLSKYGGMAFERDLVEEYLIRYALEYQLPILGVCRGMQLIQDFFGVPLVEIMGHVGGSHEIIWNQETTIVNSFHHYGAYTTTKELCVMAKTRDGVIEMIQHRSYPITGIMWHPERNDPFKGKDIELLKKVFRK